MVMVDAGLDWVDVRDVAAGALTAADRAPAGASYLLGGRYATIELCWPRVLRRLRSIRMPACRPSPSAIPRVDGLPSRPSDTSTGSITSIGWLADVQAATPGLEVTDPGATVLMPGFIVPHIHPALSWMVT